MLKSTGNFDYVNAEVEHFGDEDFEFVVCVVEGQLAETVVSPDTEAVFFGDVVFFAFGLHL